MNFRKLLAVAASCAVTALSAAMFAVNSASAATVLGKAFLNAKMGTTFQSTEAEAVSNGSTIANIDGNAQYEVTWNVKNPGAGNVELLALQIGGIDSANQFTNVKYPNLSITVNEVYVDGVKADSYTANAASANYNFLDAGVGKTRVYLLSTLSDQQLCSDLKLTSPPAKTVKVVFTVAGLDTAGTSNIPGTTEPTQPSSSPFTSAATTGFQPQIIPTQGGGVVFGNSTQSDSASTGDTGVAVAVAGLVVTAGIGAAAVAFRKKK